MTKPGTPRKPAAKKKAAPRKAAKKKSPRGAEVTKRTAAKARQEGRLSAAAQSVRDTLMIQRLAQGWTWGAIAEEAGIDERTARRAVEQRRKDAPLRLNMDPVQVIERIAEGYQLSIGDLEAIGAEAAAGKNLAVAVGSKKAANEAREKLLALLQATGRLPQELSALRHLIDIRAIAVRMLDTMDEFEREMTLSLELGNAKQRKAAAVEATRKVRTTFAELMGMEEDAVEGTARELPEAAAA